MTDTTRNDRGSAGLWTALILLAVLLLGAAWFYSQSRRSGNQASVKQGEPAATPAGERKVLFYRNPMNPAITSQAPAKDEMGMDYIPVYADEGQSPKKTAQQEAADFFSDKPQPKQGERKILFYRNPMNPAITSQTAAKDEMGMDYIPVYADEASASVGNIPGLAAVTLPPSGIQLAGVRTAPVSKSSFNSVLRASGQVVADETRQSRVQFKVMGYVEKLFVNATGQAVKRGDPVLSVYSPDLLAAEEEFIETAKMVARAASSADPEARTTADELHRATRRRLELLDVPASVLDAIGKSGTPQRAVTFTAPSSGFVTAKEVLAGQKIEPGMELFTVSDLSRVWVEGNFYEYEAPQLKAGMEAKLSLPADPGKDFPARVAYVYPTVNPETRTIKVRFEVPNQGLYLKPGMYVDVSLAVNAGVALVIPDDAVIDSGTRKVVFIETGAGRYEPRLVTTGAREGGQVQVLSGVTEGEKVVVGANFLLDSESRLQAIIQRMSGGGQ